MRFFQILLRMDRYVNYKKGKEQKEIFIIIIRVADSVDRYCQQFQNYENRNNKLKEVNFIIQIPIKLIIIGKEIERNYDK